MDEHREELADRYSRDLERELGARLPAAGYHCLHNCAWSQGDRANLDHVVIGPGGVFVIDDKTMSQEVRSGTDGRVWSGGIPMDPAIDESLAQASAVGDLLGTPVTAVLALHGSHAAGLPVVRGVHLVSAADVPAFVERRSAYRSPAVVANMAAKANSVLRPERSTPAAAPRRPRGLQRSGQLAPRKSAPGRALPGRRAAVGGRLLGFAVLIMLIVVAIGLTYAWL